MNDLPIFRCPFRTHRKTIFYAINNPRDRTAFANSIRHFADAFEHYGKWIHQRQPTVGHQCWLSANAVLYTKRTQMSAVKHMLEFKRSGHMFCCRLRRDESQCMSLESEEHTFRPCDQLRIMLHAQRFIKHYRISTASGWASLPFFMLFIKFCIISFLFGFYLHFAYTRWVTCDGYRVGEPCKLCLCSFPIFSAHICDYAATVQVDWFGILK